ncbi:MAG: autoinducer binding domain-containing protein, partial [Nitrospirae bacterium]|nr:autoinducer binding domain-containing protein [Nitrospirota bacterium]
MKKLNLKIHDREKVAPEEILFYADQCHTPRQFINIMKRLQSYIPFRHMACGYGNPTTYKIANMTDLGFPKAFIQWYLKTEMIRRDPVFHEWLRTQQIQIWSDVFHRQPHQFDPEYVKKINGFKLQHTLVGGVLDIPQEIFSYFCLTMGSKKECHDYTQTFANLLPAVDRAFKNAHAKKPRFAGPLLTEKQKAILQWASEGYSRLGIARKLGITERTVQMHLAA